VNELTQETIDYIAIRRLQDAYADIVTRRAWEELSEIFLPTCRLLVDRRTGEPMAFDGPRAVGDFIGNAISHMDFFEFVILNTRVFLNDGGDPDQARARMYINELRHEDGDRFTHAYGLYQDRYQRVDGRWWFADRRYASLARTARDFDVFGLPTIE
jgi:hypothetical protein